MGHSDFFSAVAGLIPLLAVAGVIENGYLRAAGGYRRLAPPFFLGLLAFAEAWTLAVLGTPTPHEARLAAWIVSVAMCTAVVLLVEMVWNTAGRKKSHAST